MFDALKGRPLSCVSKSFSRKWPGIQEIPVLMHYSWQFQVLSLHYGRARQETMTLNGIMRQIEQIGQGFLFIKDC